MTTPVDADHQRLLERNVEPDTQILCTEFHRVDGIPFITEAWGWEGISGHTAVFLQEHVAGWSDDRLRQFLTAQAGFDLGGGVTISRSASHVFVNFAFSWD